MCWACTCSATEPSMRGLAKILQHAPCAVMSGRAGNTAARMRAGATEVEARDRRAIARRLRMRSQRKQLIRIEPAVIHIAPGKSEDALEIHRAHGLSA